MVWHEQPKGTLCLSEEDWLCWRSGKKPARSQAGQWSVMYTRALLIRTMPALYPSQGLKYPALMVWEWSLSRCASIDPDFILASAAEASQSHPQDPEPHRCHRWGVRILLTRRISHEIGSDHPSGARQCCATLSSTIPRRLFHHAMVPVWERPR